MIILAVEHSYLPHYLLTFSLKFEAGLAACSATKDCWRNSQSQEGKPDL